MTRTTKRKRKRTTMAAGDVLGLREAKAAFKRLPAVVRERIGDATRITVAEIARGAASRVPVRYGFLKRHIASTFSAQTGVGKVGITPGVERLPDSGRVVNPATYAHFPELGTRRMPAEPFMLPAAEAEKAAYLERCKAAGRGIERDMATGRNL
jgi:HK97 gp10 family phage protein